MTRTKLTAEKIKQNNNFVFYQSIGSILLAKEIAKLEDDDERVSRMNRIVKKKILQYIELFPQRSAKTKTITSMKKACHSHSLGDKQIILLTDLACNTPFFPFDIKFSESQFNDAFTIIAQSYNSTATKAETILTAKEQATKLHKPGKVKK